MAATPGLEIGFTDSTNYTTAWLNADRLHYNQTGLNNMGRLFAEYIAADMGFTDPGAGSYVPRVPISAKVVANMLQAVGVGRVLTMDLHADQIQGFFDIPVDNIYASPVLLGDLRQKNYEDLIVVSPDVGGMVRARALAKQLGCDLAIIDKRRPRANVSEVMHVIGDIEDRNCVVMDDMIDTAGTLVKAAEVLKERGAKKVYAYCTHPIFSGPAIDRIAKGDALDRSEEHTTELQSH